LRTYELVVIVQPDLEDEALDAVVGNFKQVVVDNGGEIVRIESMGRRRLAYPIQKRTEGHYVLMYLNLERATIQELDRRLKLSDDVLRYLLVRMDEMLTPEPEVVEEPAAVEAQAEPDTAVEATDAEATAVGATVEDAADTAVAEAADESEDLEEAI
jgi:small subunit ribosomal protein S6